MSKIFHLLHPTIVIAVRRQTTACLGRNRVSNGFCHRSMAKPIYHGKTHDIWVLPCNGFSHSSMAKPMDIMKRNIHGFCHGPLLHFCLCRLCLPKYLLCLQYHHRQNVQEHSELFQIDASDYLLPFFGYLSQCSLHLLISSWSPLQIVLLSRPFKLIHLLNRSLFQLFSPTFLKVSLFFSFILFNRTLFVFSNFLITFLSSLTSVMEFSHK